MDLFIISYSIDGTNLLSDGGTTLIVKVTGISNDGNNVDGFEENVIYKYKSVTIGNINTYYTIEDALAEATSANDEILVRANTKFAEKDIAKLIYDYSGSYDLIGKLILSYYEGEKYLTQFNDDKSNVSNASTRLDPQVILRVEDGININAKNNSEIFINAERLRQSTNVNGLVSGDKYAVLYLENYSSITFEQGSTFINYGFSVGEGIMHANAGSIVEEFMTIFDYKGGTITSAIYNYAVPILYFAPLATTNKIIFVPESQYQMYTFVTASSRREFVKVDLLKNWKKITQCLTLNQGL